MTKIYCENCGSEQLEERGGTYVCKHCHAVWRKHEIDEVYDKLAAMFDEQKQERVANLRHQLYDELNADYLDSAEIIRICNEIKGYLPDDFQAKFFYVANKNSAAYLAKYMRTIAPSKHLGYVPQILDFVLRSLQEPLINATNYFIEYAYGNNRDPKMYEKYNAILQREAQKVQASVYDPTIPRHVFVAYKSEDVRKMMELVEALEAAGLSCFVALRNLQHGKGATVNYERNLRLAMDNCEVFVLVSSVKSRTIGDAREKELNYVRQKDLENCPPQYRNNYERLPIEYKKARVEYIIENYQNLAAEKTVKQFFDGFERMYSPAQVVDAVYALHDRPILPEQPAPKQEVKYCAACGAECPQNAKFCLECGKNSFVDTHDEYIAVKAKRDMQDEMSKKFAEMQAQIEALQNAQRAAAEEAERKANDKRVAEEARNADASRTVEEAPKAAEVKKTAGSRKTEGSDKTKEAGTRKAVEKTSAAKPYKISGKFVTFGRYPQSKVTNANIISALNRLAGAKPSADNSEGWTVYNYYIDGVIQKFMWYKDVNYGNERFRAVYFDKWRPYFTNYAGYERYSYQSANGYNSHVIAWFKWEPIKWRILNKSNGELTLLSDVLLDSQQYFNHSKLRKIDRKAISANNYAHSDIRAWLNDDFLNAAFTEQEKNFIKTTLTSNSAATMLNGSRSYACENTSDKIYLLSYKDVTNAKYGFDADRSVEDAKRQLGSSDYAKAQGAYADKDHENAGWWWLRSPDCSYNHEYYALHVVGTGVVESYNVDSTRQGVAPALQLVENGVDELQNDETERKVEVARKAEEEKNAAPYTPIDDKHVAFGYYPQSKVRDGDLISSLNRLAGSTPSASNSAGWTDCKYYILSRIISFMWYKDVNYAGEKYRAVYFKNWRPKYTEYTGAPALSNQGKNGYKLGEIYWFKWEPIKWKILQKSDKELTLFSEMLLDSQHYFQTISGIHTRAINGKTVYPNNYEQSDIRAWLNEDFLNAAFSEQEKKSIKTALVKNSFASDYACKNTLDKIYLLSYNEAWDKDCGFITDSDRKLKPTDYAQAQGAYAGVIDGGGMGWWWLRTPSSEDYNHALGVSSGGDVNFKYVYCTDGGIAPALKVEIKG